MMFDAEQRRKENEAIKRASKDGYNADDPAITELEEHGELEPRGTF